jgi:hypothetical protein
MNEMTFLSDIVKYSISGVLIFFVAWNFIKPMLMQRLNFQRVELKKSGLQHTLPLRLQAYERSVLFIERINPSNLLVRLHAPGMSATQLHQIVLAEIRSEYQHNISQQIYVSDISWSVVKRIKDETIGIVSSALNTLPPEASAMDLSKSVLTHLAGLESENPYDVALSLVKRDIQNLF